MVTSAEGEALAREYKIPFFETSALNNTNVDNAFMALVTEIKLRLDAEEAANSRAAKEEKKGSKAHKLKSGDEKPKRGCCG